MRIKNRKPEPIITLRWNEYKKKSVLERFPISALCGILILTASLSFLHDRWLAQTATDEPISSGLAVIEAMSNAD